MKMKERERENGGKGRRKVEERRPKAVWSFLFSVVEMPEKDESGAVSPLLLEKHRLAHV